MAKEKSQVGIILTSAIIVILAVAFIMAIADQTNNSTSKSVVKDEVISLATAKTTYYNLNQAVTFSVANSPTEWRSTDCPLTSIVVTNSTGTALTVTDDYTLTASTGVLLIKNTTATVAAFKGNNNTLVDYTYCGTNYLNSDWGRTVLGVNVGVYAIGILLAGVLLVYLLLGKEED